MMHRMNGMGSEVIDVAVLIVCGDPFGVSLKAGRLG